VSRRTLAWIAGIVLVVLAIAWGFVPRPVTVDVAAVERGPLEVTVREEGKTRVVERYVISAPVAGYARRLALDVGDVVEESEVVLRLEALRSQVLDPRARAQAEARVEGARAALEATQEEVAAAEADADFAAAELERMRELFDRGGVARRLLDSATADARRSAARREAAQRAVDVAAYDLEAARTALRYSAAGDGNAGGETVLVRSPVDGRVLTIINESEGVVGAGQPLLEIGNPAALEVEVEVLSADAVRISPGTAVRFERWGGDAVLDGVVRRVEPVGFTKISALGVEEQRVRVIAGIVSPPELWEQLGDQFRVDATFVLWRGEDALQAPSSALFRRGDGWAAFVVVDGAARLREVEVGRRSGLRAEILSGLSAGETVIAHPGDQIADGTAVRPR